MAVMGIPIGVPLGECSATVRVMGQGEAGTAEGTEGGLETKPREVSPVPTHLHTQPTQRTAAVQYAKRERHGRRCTSPHRIFIQIIQMYENDLLVEQSRLAGVRHLDKACIKNVRQHVRNVARGNKEEEGTAFRTRTTSSYTFFDSKFNSGMNTDS